MFSNKIVVISVSVILLAGSVFLGILSWKNIIQKQKQEASIQVDPGHLTEPKNDGMVGTPPIKPIEEEKRDGEIEWLSEPVKLSDLKLISYAPESWTTDEMVSDYYKTADINGGGEIINAYVPPQGPSGKLVIRFKKTSEEKYFLLKQNSDFDDSYLVSSAEIDSETNINSLNAPEKITLKNIIFTKESWSDKMPLEWSSLEKIDATAYGDFYKKLTASDYNLDFVEYVLKMPDSTAFHYNMPYDFLADDNSLVATLNDAEQEFKNKKFSSRIIPGCSGINDFVSQVDLTDRLYPIGTTASGSELYTAKDANDELYKAVYNGYKIGRDGTVNYDGKPVLTYEEFVAKKPLLVWRDGLNDYHIFYDSEYAPLAECGKPVIYLYPKVKAEVKVKVGAKVRISEPDYDEGWEVTANPNGKIINSDGAVYENLYWEGLGRGNYPRITEGRVVRSENIKAELKSDLAVLGLNEKESADFMEFWLPRMPKTPYIRLTWLDTVEMNELAPLTISPRPDTVKRVFLDFSGQSTAKTTLVPQKLSGFTRNGFTVVEWGGLSIGNK